MEMKFLLALLAVSIMAASPILLVSVELPEDTREHEREIEDRIPPVSSIHSPAYYLVPPEKYMNGTPMIGITWDGIDPAGGSGIDHYDVHYRVSSELYFQRNIYYRPSISGWKALVEGTSSNNFMMRVEPDRYYSFRVRAVDQSGNFEDWSEIAESRTLVLEIPIDFYELLMQARERVEERIEKIREKIPEDTAPISRVLPMRPMVVPEIHMDGEEMDVVLYPDLKIDNCFCAPPDTGIPWTYPSVEVKWNGFDPKGSQGLEYDVQLRRSYLAWQVYHIPEKIFQPIVIPDRTEWKDWISDTTSNGEFFKPEKPGIYEFRCRAEDDFGNVERYPLHGDTAIMVLPAY